MQEIVSQKNQSWVEEITACIKIYQFFLTPNSYRVFNPKYEFHLILRSTNVIEFKL